MSAAATIKRQIGIWPLAEVGARGFMQDAQSLYFDAKPRTRIVRVIVTLTPADTYTLRVLAKATGAELHTAEGLYAEDLPAAVRTLASKI